MTDQAPKVLFILCEFIFLFQPLEQIFQILTINADILDQVKIKHEWILKHESFLGV